MRRTLPRPTEGPSAATVKRRLRELRRLIEDDTASMCTVRIAYAMEEAIRWATEDTVGWGSPAQIARENADILARDLRS